VVIGSWILSIIFREKWGVGEMCWEAVASFRAVCKIGQLLFHCLSLPMSSSH
jgi:hypothetical protein